jgi:crotonobetainyl-CoA:carnitine CoA-transferase CaiB-like acyl-CoA transferase
VLDLKDEDDLALAHELAARADILIENMRPGGMTRFGLDYDTVRAGNPGSSTRRSPGSAPRRQGAKLAGYDLMVQGISGLMSLTGDPDGPAYRAGISVFDVMAGMHATIGILAALNRRHDTGVGQHIEVNLLSSALSGLVNHTSAVVASDVTPFRMGNAHPSLFPYEPLPTADGEIIVIAGNDGQFVKLCEVLGIPRSRRTSASAATRTAPHAATSSRPCCSTRSASARPRSGSSSSRPTACPAGR